MFNRICNNGILKILNAIEHTVTCLGLETCLIKNRHDYVLKSYIKKLGFNPISVIKPHSYYWIGYYNVIDSFSWIVNKNYLINSSFFRCTEGTG